MACLCGGSSWGMGTMASCSIEWPRDRFETILKVAAGRNFLTNFVACTLEATLALVQILVCILFLLVVY